MLLIAVTGTEIPMTPRIPQLLLVGIVLIAGCSGVIANDGTPDSEPDKLRLVIQNEVSSAETIALTLTAENGDTLLDATKTVRSDGGWIVTTLAVSDLQTPVTVTARLPGRNETIELTPIRGSDRGARLHTITDDGIGIYECNTNVTCWQQKPIV